jgi:hypothetical protein
MSETRTCKSRKEVKFWLCVVSLRHWTQTHFSTEQCRLSGLDRARPGTWEVRAVVKALRS